MRLVRDLAILQKKTWIRVGIWFQFIMDVTCDFEKKVKHIFIPLILRFFWWFAAFSSPQDRFMIWKCNLYTFPRISWDYLEISWKDPGSSLISAENVKKSYLWTKKENPAYDGKEISRLMLWDETYLIDTWGPMENQFQAAICREFSSTDHCDRRGLSFSRPSEL